MEKKENKPIRKLTIKEKLFCIEWCICRNASEAARRAGYSVKTAFAIGAENLKKPKLIEYISHLNGNFEELMAEKGITKGNLVKMHWDFINCSITDFHDTWIERKDFNALSADQKKCIEEIDTKVEYKVFDEAGKHGKRKIEYVKIKLVSRQESMKELAKLLGFIAPVKSELTGKDGKDLIPRIGKDNPESEIYE